MRVLFDARPAAACATGIGRYAQTVGWLLREGVGRHWCARLGTEDTELRLRAQDPIEAELELPALLVREQVDLFHSPLFQLPALLPRGVGAVVTIHDAIAAVRPELTAPAFAALFAGAGAAARRSLRVVCPTEHARRDVVRALGLAEERVSVLPETPAPCFRTLEREHVTAALAPFALEPGGYALVVGSLEERKNPGLVLEAWAAAPELPPVVFAGPKAGYQLEAQALALGLGPRVRALGLLDDETLVALYNGAVGLIAASHYEGFGLPIVEAFACGTPVLAARAASLPEVGGEAALTFDPDDPGELVGRVRELLRDAAVRTQLRGAGRARLEARYSPGVVRSALSALYDELEGAA